MKKIALVTAALAVAAASLSACGPTVQERCASAKDPAECVKVADAGGDVNDYLLYGMAGYMLGSMNGRTVIVQDPAYRGYRRPVPSYARSYTRAVESKTSSWKQPAQSSYRTTTTVRYSSPSSSAFRSSYSSSSSFRSGGFGRR